MVWPFIIFYFLFFGSKTVKINVGTTLLGGKHFPFLRNVPFYISLISFKWGHGGYVSNGVSKFSGCVGVCKHVSTLGDASLCMFGISCQSNIFIEFGNQIS